MRPKTITLAIACAVAIAGLLGTVERTSSGQQENIRKQPACTIFCGDGTFNTINLGAKPCWGGPLPADSAGDQFNGLPEQDQAAICRNFAAANKSKESCPAFKALAQLCKGKEKPPNSGDKKPPDVKCEPPRNNFAPGGASDEFNPFDCKNLQRVQIAISGDYVTASACGRVLLRRYADSREELNNIARRLRNNAPSKICCERLSADETAGEEFVGGSTSDSGFPDGEPGSTSYQDTDFCRFPDESTFEPMPPGMRIPDILPDMSCKGCKWELVTGEAKCQPRGRNAGLFWYEATWRCPRTGVEVFKASKQRLLQQQCK